MYPSSFFMGEMGQMPQGPVKEEENEDSPLFLRKTDYELIFAFPLALWKNIQLPKFSIFWEFLPPSPIIFSESATPNHNNCAELQLCSPPRCKFKK